MKIIKKKITASTDVVKIPAPLNKYYDIISDEEFEEMTGADPLPYICEEISGYDAKHLAYVIAKPEYEEQLANNGIDIVELVSEAGHAPFLGYVVYDRLYAVTIEDIHMAGIDGEEERDDEYDEEEDY